MMSKASVAHTVTIGVLLLIIGMLSSMIYKVSHQPETVDIVTVSDTVTIHSTDTLYVPVEKVHYDTILTLDTVHVHDTIMLREQKVYSDTLSTIYISGIEAELDSVRYYIPRDTVLINTETTITKTKKKGFGQFIGIGASVGTGMSYDIVERNINPSIPFVGVTLTYGFGYHW